MMRYSGLDRSGSMVLGEREATATSGSVRGFLYKDRWRGLTTRSIVHRLMACPSTPGQLSAAEYLDFGAVLPPALRFERSRGVIWIPTYLRLFRLKFPMFFSETDCCLATAIDVKAAKILDTGRGAVW